MDAAERALHEERQARKRAESDLSRAREEVRRLTQRIAQLQEEVNGGRELIAMINAIELD